MIEIELGGFVRGRQARYWGAFVGIEDDDVAIVRRVVRPPVDHYRTSEALSSYSMAPRLMEGPSPLLVIGIASGRTETLLIQVGSEPIDRVEVDADALAAALEAACRTW